jgi:hypothetical protein
MSKRKGRQLDTEILALGLTAEQVSARARDRNLPAAERARYLRHEKALGLRNREKRSK